MTEPQKESSDTTVTQRLLDPSHWGPMLDLQCMVALEIALPAFTVGDLLRLEPGAVIDSGWNQADDVAVQINGTRIGVAEFDSVGERMAMRVSEWI